MSDKPVSGYEGYDQGSEPDQTVIQIWRLELVERGYVYGLVGQIFCNNEGRAVVTFKSKGEFEWLKRRIDGERNPRLEPKSE